MTSKNIKEYEKYLKDKADHEKRMDDIMTTIGGPYLEFEISESPYNIDEIVEAVEKKFPGYRFWGTEKRYQSCIMAIFER